MLGYESKWKGFESIWAECKQSWNSMKNLSSNVRIRIHMERIRICMSRVQTELKWDEWIRIPIWWIRISKSKFQSKAADRSWICIPKKKGIFVYVPDIFGLGLFLTKIKIRSKSFYGNLFRIISSSSTTLKLIPIQESLLRSEEVKIALSDSNPNQKDSKIGRASCRERV